MPTNTITFTNAYVAYVGHLFFFVGGTLITLLVSIFDVTRRTALKLFAGCIFGGIGALVAGLALEGWGTAWMLGGAGIAAVMTENIVMGFVKASENFRDSPFATLGTFLKDLLPSIPGFGKKAD